MNQPIPARGPGRPTVVPKDSQRFAGLRFTPEEKKQIIEFAKRTRRTKSSAVVYLAMVGLECELAARSPL